MKGLRNFPKSLVFDFHQKNCHRQLQNVIDDNKGRIIQECVPGHFPCLTGFKKEPKIIHPIPWTPKDTVYIVIFLKCQNDPGHWNIVE